MTLSFDAEIYKIILKLKKEVDFMIGRSELVDKGCRVEIWHKDTLSLKSKRG